MILHRITETIIGIDEVGYDARFLVILARIPIENPTCECGVGLALDRIETTLKVGGRLVDRNDDIKMNLIGWHTSDTPECWSRP